MSDKEALIAEYGKLERGVVRLTHDMTTDIAIIKATQQYKALAKDIAFRKQVFETEIQDKKTRQNEIKEALKTSWNTEDKTYKCTAGTATLRITKALILSNNVDLMQCLSEILPKHFAEACGYIKAFDLMRIRKLKDARLISDEIVHYELKQSVSIKVMEADDESK